MYSVCDELVLFQRLSVLYTKELYRLDREVRPHQDGRRRGTQGPLAEQEETRGRPWHLPPTLLKNVQTKEEKFLKEFGIRQPHFLKNVQTYTELKSLSKSLVSEMTLPPSEKKPNRNRFVYGMASLSESKLRSAVAELDYVKLILPEWNECKLRFYVWELCCWPQQRIGQFSVLPCCPVSGGLGLLPFLCAFCNFSKLVQKNF